MASNHPGSAGSDRLDPPTGKGNARPNGPAPVPRPSLPDRLTRFRLAMVPLLWIVAALGNTTWLGAGLAVAALSDVIDGPIARQIGKTTARGSRMDSIADHALTASAAAWLVWLRPEFVAEQWRLLAAWITIGIAALVVGWLRFRRFGDIHLYSAKVAGTVGYLFIIWLLLFGTYSVRIFHVVIAACLIAAAESLLVVSTRSRVDEHAGSILLPPRRGPRSQD